MIELGKVQELEIVRTKEFGVYLSEKAGDEAAVLLPKKKVPEGARIGDRISVLYIRTLPTVSLPPPECRSFR